jgi:hypothetical protein
MPNRLLPPACWSTAKQRIRHSPGFGIASTVMRRDTGNARTSRVLPKHLPDDLFGHGLALYLVAWIYRAE